MSHSITTSAHKIYYTEPTPIIKAILFTTPIAVTACISGITGILACNAVAEIAKKICFRNEDATRLIGIHAGGFIGGAVSPIIYSAVTGTPIPDFSLIFLGAAGGAYVGFGMHILDLTFSQRNYETTRPGELV